MLHETKTLLYNTEEIAQSINQCVSIGGYSITKKDIESFKAVVSYIDDHMTVYSIDHIVSICYDNQKDSQFGGNICLMKLMMMLIWYHEAISNEFQLKQGKVIDVIMKALKKCFFEGLLSHNEIIGIVKYTVIYSMIDHETRGNNQCLIDKHFRNNEKVFLIVIKWMVSFYKELLTQAYIKALDEIIYECLDFIKGYALENYDNIIIISQDNMMMSLIELVKIEGISLRTVDIIIKTIIRVYSFRFNMRLIYDGIDELFSNGLWTQNMRLISGHMKLLERLMIEEDKTMKDSSGMLIRKGFYYTNQGNSAILSSPMSFPKDGYSLVISFNLRINTNTNESYIIFAIENQVLSYITNNHLMFSFGKVTKESFTVKSNHTYTLWLFHKGSKAILILNGQRLQIDNIIYPTYKNKPLISLGHSPNDLHGNNFRGEIGSFILFNKHFAKESLQNNLMNLQEKYEDILFINHDDHRLIKLSSEQKSPFISSQLSKNIEIIISNQSICKFNHDNTLIGSSMVYQANYHDNLSNATFELNNINPNIVNKETCLNQMIMHDGIMFIELNIVYLINCITNDDHSNTDLIIQCYSDIIKTFMQFLIHSNCMKDYRKEIDNCFISFKQLSHLLNESKGMKMSLGLFCCFFNNFDYLLESNLFFDQSDFFLEYSYYDDRTLICLFTVIDNHMLKHPLKFFTVDFLKLILSFDSVFTSLLINNTKKAYKEFIRNYIMICLRNKDYKSIVLFYIEKVLTIRINTEGNLIRKNMTSSLEGNLMICQQDNETLIPMINDDSVLVLYQYMKLLYNAIVNKSDYEMLLKIIHTNHTDTNSLKNRLFDFLSNIFHVTEHYHHSQDNHREYYHIELLKSFTIRLLDDFFYRPLDNDANKTSIDNSKSPNRHKSKLKERSSNDESTTLLHNTFPYLNTSSLFTSSQYTFRSFFLTLFLYEPKNQQKLNFIKSPNKSISFNNIKPNPFNKIFYEIIQLFTKITSIEISISNHNEQGIHLVMSSYDLLLTFIKGILSKYKEQTSAERTQTQNQQIIRELFYSKSLCYLMYKPIFGSEYFSYDKIVIDSQMLQGDLYQSFKERVINDLYEMISNTFLIINNPFYILLLSYVYFKHDEDEFVIGGISKMITALQHSDESSVMTKEFNHKNLVILIHTITFYDKKRPFLFTNTVYLKEIILYLLALPSKSLMIYLKTLFPIDILFNEIMMIPIDTKTTGRNSKMIIEVIFDIYYELYKERNHYGEYIKEGLIESLILELVMKKGSGLSKKEKNSLCYLIDVHDKKQKYSKKPLESKQELLKKLRVYQSNKGMDEYEGSVTLFFLIKIVIHIYMTKTDEMVSSLTYIAEQLFNEANMLHKKKGRNLLAAKNYIESPLYTEFRMYIQNMAISDNHKEFSLNDFKVIMDSKTDEIYTYISNSNTGNTAIMKGVSKSKLKASFANSIVSNEDNSIDGESQQFKSNENLSTYPSSGLKRNLAFMSPQKCKSNYLLNKLSIIIYSKHSKSVNSLIEKQKPLSLHEQPMVTKCFSFNHDFLKKTFSVYFTSLLSYDPLFVDMNNLYYDCYHHDIEDLKTNILHYPTKMKNMTSRNYSRLFLKKDFKFWMRDSLKYSHNFLLNYPKRFDLESIRKNTFTMPQLPKYTIEENSNEEESIEIHCEMITLSGNYFGKLTIYRNAICFNSNTTDPDLRNYNAHSNTNNNNDSSALDYVLCSCDNDWDSADKTIILLYSDIEEALTRRYIHMWIGIEFFMKDGHSYLFNLFTASSHDKLFQYLHSNQVPIITNLQEYFLKQRYTEQWLDHSLSTYDYLLLVNKFSSRSLNDINQYPIFPWIHLGEEEGNETPTEFKHRDFSCPISLQTPHKKKEYLLTDLSTINGIKREHGSHYSTSAFVCFYLMRINPFTSNMIKLQSNRFDDPNRQFAMLNDVLILCKSFKENREPIPELLSSPDYFYNYNRNDFGMQEINKEMSLIKKDFHRVHDVIFKPWASDAYNYTYQMRLRLNNDWEINQHITEWIDYTFGYMQYSSNKDGDCFRNFSLFSYEQLWDFERRINEGKKSGEDAKEVYQEIKNCIAHILNFGQCPYQLFKEEHPKKTVVLMNNQQENTKEEINKRLEHYTSSSYELTMNTSNTIMNDNRQIVYIGASKYNKDLLYCLTTNHELEVYSTKTLERTKHQYPSFHHFDFLPRINSTIDDNQPFLYKPKYIFCELSELNFIFVRYIDNSMSIWYNSSLMAILLESFITAILHIKDNEFITGHETGEIFLWKIMSNPFISLTQTSRLQSNQSGITSMVYNHKLNIFITADKSTVIIRNHHTLEYLTLIKPSQANNQSVTVVDMKISPYDQLYIMCYCHTSQYSLMGYTLNGVFFGKIEGFFNEYAFASNGNLLCGYFNANIIRVYHSITFVEVYKKTLPNIDMIDHFHYDPNAMVFHVAYQKNKTSSIETVRIDNQFEIPYFCDT